MIGLIVGSILFEVSVLILFPSGVVGRLYSSSRLSIQVKKPFALPALIFLLAFYSTILFTTTFFIVICLILLIVFGSIVLLVTIHSYSNHFRRKGSHDLPENLPENLPLSHFISYVGLYY